MKKPVAIVFILLLLIQSGGYVLFFKAEQERIRHHVSKSVIGTLHDETLFVITTSNLQEDINRGVLEFINSHEILYQGLMHDIVRYETRGNKILYYCYVDHDESALMSDFKSLVRHSTDHQPLSRQMLTVISMLITPFIFNEIPHIDKKLAKATQLRDPYLFSSVTWILETPTPPPLV